MNLWTPAPGLEPDLDEDSRTLLDVVAGGLNQPRHLAQLGNHASCTFGFRGIGEERLPG